MQNTNYEDYEVIVVDNASTDGTKERIDWVRRNTTRYKKIKYIRKEKNLGDRFGMVEGSKHASGDYIVQLDSDCIVHPNRLRVLKTGLDFFDYGAFMLKREDIQDNYTLRTTNDKEETIGGLVIHHGTIERPVACYIMRKEDFDKVEVEEGKHSKYMIGQMYKCGKCTNHTVQILDMLPIIANIPLNYHKYNRTNMKAFV